MGSTHPARPVVVSDDGVDPSSETKAGLGPWGRPIQRDQSWSRTMGSTHPARPGLVYVPRRHTARMDQAMFWLRRGSRDRALRGLRASSAGSPRYCGCLWRGSLFEGVSLFVALSNLGHGVGGRVFPARFNRYRRSLAPPRPPSLPPPTRRWTLVDHDPYSPPSRSPVSSLAPCGTRPLSAVRVPLGAAARQGLCRHDGRGSSPCRPVGAPGWPSSRRPGVRSLSRRGVLQVTFCIGICLDVRARCGKPLVQCAFAARGWRTLGLSHASDYWLCREGMRANGILYVRGRREHSYEWHALRHRHC